MNDVDLIDRLSSLTIKLNSLKVELTRVLSEVAIFQTDLSPVKKISLQRMIMRLVCKFYDLSIEQIISESREGDIRKARQVLCVLLKNYTSMSYNAIGKLVNRDHATVIHCMKVLSDAKDTNQELHFQYRAIEKQLQTLLVNLENEIETP